MFQHFETPKFKYFATLLSSKKYLKPLGMDKRALGEFGDGKES